MELRLCAVLLFCLGMLAGTANASEYVFTAAPRGTLAEESATYQPVADFLTKATGQKFTYQFSDNWLTYQSALQEGKYDLIFDGPHFVAWRIHQQGANVLVKLPQPHIWVVIAKADDAKATSIAALGGRAVCAPAPPNFGTLTLQSLFSNPARQPFIHQTKGWKNGYDGVIAGKCRATILPLSNLKKFDPDGRATKVIYQHTPYPNQGLTASSKIPLPLQARIRDALLSSEGQAAMTKLRERYAHAKGNVQALVPANNDEYATVDLVLKDTRGFEFTPATVLAEGSNATKQTTNKVNWRK